MLWQLLLVVFILWSILTRLQQKKLIARCKLKEFDAPVLPLVGQALSFFNVGGGNSKYFSSVIRELLKAKDQLVVVWMSVRPVIVVSDPENARSLLKVLHEKGVSRYIIKDLLQNASIFAPVNIWRERRKFTAELFMPKLLSMYMDAFIEHSEAMSKRMLADVGKESVQFWAHSTTYSFGTSCTNLFDIDVTDDNEFNKKFVTTLDTGMNIVSDRVFKPWLWNDTIFKLHPMYKVYKDCKKEYYRFLNQVFDDRKKMHLENNNNEELKMTTILDLLMTRVISDKQLSRLEIIEEMLTMLLASADTTAVSLSCICTLLACYPDVQEKVFQELKTVFGDSDRKVTLADLSELKYLECVLMETIRLYSPAPIIERRSPEDITLSTGQTVPKGAHLLIPIWAIHRNPDYWGPDAKVFRPERFMEPLKHPAQFIAFSYGPRNCIGYKYSMMSQKTVLSMILRRFIFLPAKGHEVGKVPFNFKFSIVLREVHNFPIKIALRT